MNSNRNFDVKKMKRFNQDIPQIRNRPQVPFNS